MELLEEKHFWEIVDNKLIACYNDGELKEWWVNKTTKHREDLIMELKVGKGIEGKDYHIYMDKVNGKLVSIRLKCATSLDVLNEIIMKGGEKC